MNANQLINMAMRMIMRRLMRRGIDAGIGAVGKRMNNGSPTGDAPNSKETQKRARSTMKIARRMGRM
ncbi:hypothetical protein [Roseovarius sp. M141]|uniref:hypothetical protein n=1 Tax=Roseovarius sp. M141 TaxID=2583806 RepID=UPI0020CF9E21|nr:hypothetical protein [Roseovarius sp. M141]MCQ0093229.1 hypothetical protein [Roseovarius sp. M141]